MDLSVIIPVYNTPIESLKRCFDSVTFAEDIRYEVIVIDDGSERAVGEFCKEYTNTRSQFSYHYQSNRGVSAARNAGMSKAIGKYIMYVDADDELLPNAIKKEYFHNSFDVVFFDIEVKEQNRTTRRRVFDFVTNAQLRKKDYVMAACMERMNSACGCLFLHNLLVQNRILFDETMVIAEDAKFVWGTIQAAQNLFYADDVIYRYYHSHSNGEKRLVSFPNRVLENLIDFYYLKRKTIEGYGKKWNFTEQEKLLAEHCLSVRFVEDMFNSLGTLALNKRTWNNMKENIDEALRGIAAQELKCFPIKTRIKFWVLKKEGKILMEVIAILRQIILVLRG